jgi:hypothetical protein
VPADPGLLPAVFEWGYRVLLVVGGLGGLTALFMVRTQKRKLTAESGKTDAEADSILADASAKKTDREGRILDMSEKLLAQMQDRLEDAEAKIDRLTEYIEVLVQALRTGGQPVPPMPRQMRQEAHDREASRGGTPPP